MSSSRRRSSPARSRPPPEGTPPTSRVTCVVMPHLSRPVVATLGKIYEGVQSRAAAVSLFRFATSASARRPRPALHRPLLPVTTQPLMLAVGARVCGPVF